jgi:hypothetical protein
LTLRASARQAGGLADDEAGRLERSGEAGESLGRVGDRVGAAAGGVEHDDCGFTDVASDEPRGRGGVRHLRLSSYELGIVCGRASGDGGPFNSSSVQGKREDGPDDSGLRAPSRDGQSPRIPSSGTTPPTRTPRDNREQRSDTAIQEPQRPMPPGLLRFARNGDRGSTELHQAPGRSKSPATFRLVLRRAGGASRRTSLRADREGQLDHSSRPR